MTDSRIIIEIDYEPNLKGEDYPPEVLDKVDAMEYDVELYRRGHLDDMDLIQFADSVEIRVEKL